jgi:hypothetical protein
LTGEFSVTSPSAVVPTRRLRVAVETLASGGGVKYRA